MAAFAVVPLHVTFGGTDGWQYVATASASAIIVAALWSAVAVAAMLRWRRLVLAGSCVLSAGMIYGLVYGAVTDPYLVGASWWRVVGDALTWGRRCWG